MGADLLLAIGLGATLIHFGCDLVKLKEHIKHPRDWFVALSAPALLLHVILSGELAHWYEQLGADRIVSWIGGL